MPKVASMRPRRERRGEDDPAGVKKNLKKLQCGHGASAVENISWLMQLRNVMLELQCGHGASAVEKSPCRGGPSPTVQLQCGHGASAVEKGAKSSTLR